MKFYDRDGSEISMEVYFARRKDKEYCFIEKTVVGDTDVMSTWFGTDQGDEVYYGKPPLIFGTIVYDNVSKEWGDEWFDSSEAECRKRHAEAVARLHYFLLILQ